MKLSRKLVPAIAMLLVSAVMLSTASFAWFSMNTTVTATGVQVQAQAMGSLIISTSPPTSTTNTNEAAATTTMSTILTDVTRGTGSAGLKTVDADYRYLVDIDNGTVTKPTDVEDSAFWQQIDTDDVGYFADFVVYIAAKSDDIDGPKGLKATLLSPYAEDDFYYNAITVDFYVEEALSSNGTAAPTNPAELPAYDSSKVKTASFESTKNITTIPLTNGVPVATGTAAPDGARYGYLKVTMRVYIDGAHADVMNDTWTATLKDFAVQFDIVPAT